MTTRYKKKAKKSNALIIALSSLIFIQSFPEYLVWKVNEKLALRSKSLNFDYKSLPTISSSSNEKIDILLDKILKGNLASIDCSLDSFQKIKEITLIIESEVEILYSQDIKAYSEKLHKRLTNFISDNIEFCDFFPKVVFDQGFFKISVNYIDDLTKKSRIYPFISSVTFNSANRCTISYVKNNQEEHICL